jgi:hypothetical protein
MKLHKKQLQKIINKYFYTIRLVFYGKNNLPYIDSSIQDYIIYLIMNEKDILSEFDITKLTIASSEQYKFRETLFYYIEDINKFKHNQHYKNIVIDFMDLLLENKNIFITNKNFNKLILNKLKELNYIFNKLSNEYDIVIIEKIKYTAEKIYSIDCDKICIKHNCCLYKSKLSYNFGLCHNHLIKHFIPNKIIKI